MLANELDDSTLGQELHVACLIDPLSDMYMAEWSKATTIRKSTSDIGWDIMNKSIIIADHQHRGNYLFICQNFNDHCILFRGYCCCRRDCFS